MRRLAAVLALCVASQCFAQDADDAPTAENDGPPALVIEAGRVIDKDGNEVYVSKGLYMNQETAVAVAKVIKGCDAEVQVLKEEIQKKETASNGFVVVVAVVAAIMGAGLGVGVSLALKQ